MTAIFRVLETFRSKNGMCGKHLRIVVVGSQREGEGAK